VQNVKQKSNFFNVRNLFLPHNYNNTLFTFLAAGKNSRECITELEKTPKILRTNKGQMKNRNHNKREIALLMGRFHL